MKALLPLLALALAGCSVPVDRAQNALSAYGFKDVKLGGISLFGCDKGDGFTRTFEAAGPTGQHVSGVVCAGLFKGETVRITGQ